MARLVLLSFVLLAPNMAQVLQVYIDPKAGVSGSLVYLLQDITVDGRTIYEVRKLEEFE